jgi:hypothetical protein
MRVEHSNPWIKAYEASFPCPEINLSCRYTDTNEVRYNYAQSIFFFIIQSIQCPLTSQAPSLFITSPSATSTASSAITAICNSSLSTLGIHRRCPFQVDVPELRSRLRVSHPRHLCDSQQPD